jgi:hypothetical protein
MLGRLRTVGVIDLNENLPKKLKHDAIVEATFEVRFEAEISSVAEVLLGRLADTPVWSGFTPRRLPTADIPSALRRADPNLRYQAAIELLAPSGEQRVGIGPQNLSFTRTAPYPCAYRKSHPAILMVQSAQDRAADDIPGPLNAARDRGILVQ